MERLQKIGHFFQDVADWKQGILLNQKLLCEEKNPTASGGKLVLLSGFRNDPQVCNLKISIRRLSWLNFWSIVVLECTLSRTRFINFSYIFFCQTLAEAEDPNQYRKFKCIRSPHIFPTYLVCRGMPGQIHFYGIFVLTSNSGFIQYKHCRF